MEYRSAGGLIIAEHVVSKELSMSFVAEDVRRAASGSVHARMRIMVNATTLAWSAINVETDRDRIHLVNSAWKHVEGHELGKVFPKDHAQHEFDLFCDGLWNMHLDRFKIGPVSGMAERGPIPFLIKPYLIREASTILFGPPGKGKSYAALLMAVSLDAGISTLFPVQQQQNVLFVNLERSEDSIRRRLGMVNEALGLPSGRPLAQANVRGMTLAGISEAVRRYMGGGRHFLVLDSLSRAGAGSMVKDDTGNTITDMLNQVAPYGWFAIGHTPRADDSHIFGTMMFQAACDVEIQFLSQDIGKDALGVGFSITKANDIPTDWPTNALAFTFDRDAGLTSATPADAAGFVGLTVDRAGTGDLAERYLLRVGWADAETVAREIGKDRTTVSRYLSKDRRFTSRVSGKRIEYSVAGGE